MIELRGRLCLLSEAAQAILIGGQLGWKNLQRDFPIELQVLRQVDLTHSTRTDLRADFVVTEFCACVNRHTCRLVLIQFGE